MHIDPALIVSMDRPGPRYTSYPTVPSWSSSFADAELDEALASVRGPADVYVHIPFCREQCWFCGCNQVVAGVRSAGDRYLDALALELAALPFPGRLEAARIHLGGGTPTWLDIVQLERLFDLLETRFRPGPGAEISVEIDPDVTSDEQLRWLASRGTTRISVGVQSTDDRVLAAINRPQEHGRVERTLALGRELGMRGLNVDLIYGLPFQDRDSWAATLDDVLRLRPDRLAVFGFAHVPWAKPHQARLKPETLPGPVERVSLFLLARERLLDAGYVEIGLDHFALPDDPLGVAAAGGQLHRNFMGYTTETDLPLVGVGVSAISELGDVYAQLQPHLGTWYRATEQRSGPRVAKGLRLSAEDRLRRAVITSLMCSLSISKPEIEARHGVAFDDHFARALAGLRQLAAQGLVELAADRIEVTPLGRLLVRNVAMAFDDRLAEGRFSRTI